jgi:hypothetical protein
VQVVNRINRINDDCPGKIAKVLDFENDKKEVGQWVEQYKGKSSWIKPYEAEELKRAKELQSKGLGMSEAEFQEYNDLSQTLGLPRDGVIDEFFLRRDLSINTLLEEEVEGESSDESTDEVDDASMEGAAEAGELQETAEEDVEDVLPKEWTPCTHKHCNVHISSFIRYDSLTYDTRLTNSNSGV